MDYEKIYDNLIAYRRNNVPSGYFEKHHTQMLSLGGTDDKENLVSLTAREHYIAHLLLARLNPCSQTAYALWMMQCKSPDHKERPHIKSSRMYEWARKEFDKYISRNNKITSKGERNSQHGTRWICNIELKENKKIENAGVLPVGWIAGRNKWKYQKICIGCQSQFISINRKKIFCNKKCHPSKVGCVGHPHTKESKEKISFANLGNKNPKRKHLLMHA